MTKTAIYMKAKSGWAAAPPRPIPDLTYLARIQRPIKNIYLLNNEEKNDFSGLIRFLDVLNNTPTAELPAKLEPICRCRELDLRQWRSTICS